MKEAGLYPAKRECEEITSSFVAIRISLILLFSMTHAEGGMVPADSESVSSF